MQLVWLRNDLRVSDNPALYAACESAQPVEVVFIATPGQWQQHNWGSNKISWVAANLKSLKQQLNQLNIPLHISSCDAFENVPQHLNELMAELGATSLLCNAEPGFNESVRDHRVQEILVNSGYSWQRFAESNLLDYDAILTGKGAPYRVFTPFLRNARRWLSSNNPQPLPAITTLPQVLGQQLDRWHSRPPYQLSWPPGELQAWRTLQAFIDSPIQQYQTARDVPSIAGTSRLSPYMAIGAISPINIYKQLQQLSHGDGETTWLNELIWREFYRYLMHHYPRLSKNLAMYPNKEPCWDNNSHWFSCWAEGKTGFPLVDAGMRELNNTGWMHNRLRMLCASFLVKDLHLDWRLGEAYFMSKLIDGDFASNNGGWQWAAGCGADAAPYFRHFSPTRQAQRFDAKAVYQQRHLPELINGYPPPMVDHKAQCQRFSARVKELSNGV
ncbi:cryptochrome/photolyase family protein [Ferrimonas lipolytica]|uniref:Deoxyribodipyrimidine photo-lyase n=1 Tax=Ferrimonas lipolytica TaxID=2724191 RepID=A0A6H1UGC0_9GAMM|nr:deoxyribodipyrimidine photo-lyase [Ferrimonas lipolytica]QIZ76842.1 deoxyribodipyrimidine photo-lyase [Ferrimonas lipolytica]